MHLSKHTLAAHLEAAAFNPNTDFSQQESLRKLQLLTQYKYWGF